MQKSRGTLALIILLLFSSPFVASRTRDVSVNVHAERERQGIERYLNIRSASSPSLSPRGDRVAFLTNITGTAQVWIVGAQGGWPEQMTFYADKVDSVAWSPDGAGLVFTKSRGGDENAQLFWISADGSEIRALTNAPDVRHNFGSWSHDGRKISYASNKRDPDFFDIYVMDVAAGREEMVYQQNGSNRAVAWSHDDRQLIVTHDNEQLSLDNDLYLLDIATKQATLLTPHEGASQFGHVHFTRDNRSVILGTNDKREFYSLARMDLQSKKIEILDDTRWDVKALELSNDGAMLAYSLSRDGYAELLVREISPAGVLSPKSEPVALPSKGVINQPKFSRDNRKLAFVFDGSRFNPDIWIYETAPRKLSQVTHSSRAGIPQSSFVEPELIRYKTFDGREIPAWYYRPQAAALPLVGGAGANLSVSTGGNASASAAVSTGNVTLSVSAGRTGGLPVIVSVHGGPEGQEQPDFDIIYQYFLSRGYAILATNVRGSTGYGKTFTHLDDVRKREDSVKDLAAAVEWLKAQGGADPRRIAVMGGSYGGYMTLAAITLYPELWAAAVNTVGIANFESFLKNTKGYRRKLREVEYGSLERDLDFLRSISPIYKVDRIRTPLMVIQGKNDPRVPYTEAEQIVKALRERNAPVEYKLFEDEGHGIAKLSNRLIVYPLMADFLDRYMK